MARRYMFWCFSEAFRKSSWRSSFWGSEYKGQVALEVNRGEGGRETRWGGSPYGTPSSWPAQRLWTHWYRNAQSQSAPLGTFLSLRPRTSGRTCLCPGVHSRGNQAGGPRGRPAHSAALRSSYPEMSQLQGNLHKSIRAGPTLLDEAFAKG